MARVGVALMLAWTFLAGFYGRGSDRRIFWNAGHAVGTTSLLTASHFLYMPGAAWLLWPFARIPIAAGYVLYVAIMVGLGAAAARIAAQTYALPVSFSTRSPSPCLAASDGGHLTA